MVLTNVASIHLGILLGKKLNYLRHVNEDYSKQHGMPSLSLSLHSLTKIHHTIITKTQHIFSKPNILLNAYHTLVHIT